MLEVQLIILVPAAYKSTAGPHSDENAFWSLLEPSPFVAEFKDESKLPTKIAPSAFGDEPL